MTTDTSQYKQAVPSTDARSLDGFNPQLLGKTVTAADKLDLIPWKDGEIKVILNASEFSSFCPVTKMPDFAKIRVEYIPDEYIAETKSVKLFFQSYRNVAQFNEKLVAEIKRKFVEQLSPRWLKVHGDFNVRGGINVEAVAEYTKGPAVLTEA